MYKIKFRRTTNRLGTACKNRSILLIERSVFREKKTHHNKTEILYYNQTKIYPRAD